MSSVVQVNEPVLAAAVRNAPIGIGICDEDGRFLAISTSLARLLRRPAEEIVGRPFLNFVHPEHRPAALATYFEAVVAAAAGLRHGTRTLHCLTGDCDAIPLLASWTITEPDTDGTAYGIVYLTGQTDDPRSRPAHHADVAAHPRTATAGVDWRGDPKAIDRLTTALHQQANTTTRQGAPRRPPIPAQHYRRIAIRYLQLISQGARNGILHTIAEEENVAYHTARDWVAKARELKFLSDGRQGIAGATPGPNLDPAALAEAAATP